MTTIKEIPDDVVGIDPQRYSVDVIEVKMEKHPNADALSIVRYLNYTIVVNTASWKDGQLAAFIEPDYLVPVERPEFSFLANNTLSQSACGKKGYVVGSKRLRGIMSSGILVPAPEGSKIGDNVIDQLEVIRYDPPIDPTTRGEATKPPAGVRPVYDIYGAYKYKHLFTEGEEVVVTEKINGCNGRFTYFNGQMHCGSRTEWKRKSEEVLWWRCLELNPEIEKFCKEHQNITVYGEVYGQVRKFDYGISRGNIKFAVFDLFKNNNFMDHDEAVELTKDLNWVPIIYRGPWEENKIFALADGNSVISKTKQIREGIVVKPIKERSNSEIGRTILKIVSNAFHERK